MAHFCFDASVMEIVFFICFNIIVVFEFSGMWPPVSLEVPFALGKIRIFEAEVQGQKWCSFINSKMEVLSLQIDNILKGALVRKNRLSKLL